MPSYQFWWQDYVINIDAKFNFAATFTYNKLNMLTWCVQVDDIINFEIKLYVSEPFHVSMFSQIQAI